MEKKLRYSHQREMIYQFLLANKEHPSAEMIYEHLKETLPGLSLGTVYRNLKLLEALGKVRRVINHQGSERYDAICGDHVHFICQECGSIRDIPGIDTGSLLNSIPCGRDLQPSRLELTITGRCSRCL